MDESALKIRAVFRSPLFPASTEGLIEASRVSLSPSTAPHFPDLFQGQTIISRGTNTSK